MLGGVRNYENSAKRANQVRDSDPRHATANTIVRIGGAASPKLADPFSTRWTAPRTTLNAKRRQHQAMAAATGSALLTSSRKPSVDLKKYKRVERKNERRGSDEPKAPGEEHIMKVSAKGRTAAYVAYAAKLFSEEKMDLVTIKATGQALTTAVTCSEIVKRRIKGLHQEVKLGSLDIEDEYEAIDESKLDGDNPNEKAAITQSRTVSFIEISLARGKAANKLDKKSSGYQKPLPDSEVEEKTYEELQKGTGKRSSQSKGRKRDADDEAEGEDDESPKRQRRGSGKAGKGKGKRRGSAKGEKNEEAEEKGDDDKANRRGSKGKGKRRGSAKADKDGDVDMDKSEKKKSQKKSDDGEKKEGGERRSSKGKGKGKKGKGKGKGKKKDE